MQQRMTFWCCLMVLAVLARCVLSVFADAKPDNKDAPKPLPAEISVCRQFLIATIENMPSLRAIVALGRVAHESTLKALGLRAAAAPFAHGAMHQAGAIKLYDSYHCSRYNTNTRVLTPAMFRNVFAKVRADLS